MPSLHPTTQSHNTQHAQHTQHTHTNAHQHTTIHAHTTQYNTQHNTTQHNTTHNTTHTTHTTQHTAVHVHRTQHTHTDLQHDGPNHRRILSPNQRDDMQVDWTGLHHLFNFVDPSGRRARSAGSERSQPPTRGCRCGALPLPCVSTLPCVAKTLPLASWPRHCPRHCLWLACLHCCSWPRHCLCLAFPVTPWLRHCLWLACFRCAVRGQDSAIALCAPTTLVSKTLFGLRVCTAVRG